jgi:hypothetical protein
MTSSGDSPYLMDDDGDGAMEVVALALLPAATAGDGASAGDAIDSTHHGAAAATTPTTAAATSDRTVGNGANVKIAPNSVVVVVKSKHEANNPMKKLYMKMHTKANGRKSAVNPDKVRPTSEPEGRDDFASSSRKISRPIVERRSGNGVSGTKGKQHKPCLKMKRSKSSTILGAMSNRLSKRSIGRGSTGGGGTLRNKPAESKKVTFKESVSVASSYGSYDDDESIDSNSWYGDFHTMSDGGCEACDMLYPPGSLPLLPGVYHRDQSDLVSSEPTMSSREDNCYSESMSSYAHNLDEYLYLRDVKDDSSNSNNVILLGCSAAAVILREKCDDMLDFCTSTAPEAGGIDQSNIVNNDTRDSRKNNHQYNSQYKGNSSKQITTIPIMSRYNCGSNFPEYHPAEGRDDIDTSYDELAGTTAIPNLASVMEAVDNVLFPVDTQTGGRDEEAGKWNAVSTSTTKADITKQDANVSVWKNAVHMSKMSSKPNNNVNSNSNIIIERNNEIRDEEPEEPWIFKIMEEINEKSVSWADVFHGRDSKTTTLNTAKETKSPNKLDEGSGGKQSNERAYSVPDEPITSKMKKLFKNVTTLNPLAGGMSKPAHSIDTASRWYFPGGKRELESGRVQSFAGVHDATRIIPKTIFATDDSQRDISSWRDSVADTVEILPRSLKGNTTKSQVMTQQRQQNIYQLGFNQRQQIIPYQSSGNFPPLSPLTHRSPNGAGVQFNYDPLQVISNPRGTSPRRSTPLHDRYNQYMNGEAFEWEQPAVAPNSGMIGRTQKQQHYPVPLMSRLPPVVPNVNSNLSEVSANEERDRYAGMEQKQLIAEQHDHGLAIPSTHPYLGYQRTMMSNGNDAYQHVMMPQGLPHPQPHLQLQHHQLGQFTSGMPQYQPRISSHRVLVGS